MRRLLIILLSALIILFSVCGNAELIVTDSYKITFTPVLVEEIVDEGYQDGSTVYGPTITFRWAYKVSTSHQ